MKLPISLFLSSMRSGWVSLILVLLIFGISDARSYDSELKSQQSLDLLEVQMKLQAIQTLTSRGYYVSPKRLDRYRQEQEELSRGLGMGTNRDLGSIKEWVSESDKTKGDEKNLMVELAKSWGRKIITEVSKEEGVINTLNNWNRKINEMEKDRKNNALSLAREVEKLADDYNSKAPKGWKNAARRLYRGSIKDTDNLVTDIVELNKQRMAIESSWKTLTELNAWISTIEDLQNPPLEQFQAKAEKELLDYLKGKYPDANHENIEWSIGQAKAVYSSVTSTWDQLNQLDEDNNLKAYPEALRAVKQYAAIGAAFKTTLGIVRDLKVANTLGPLIDVLDYYADAISLIPTVGQKMAALYAKAEQDTLRWGGIWDKVHAQEPDRQLWKTPLMKHFGIQVVSTQTGRDGAANRYYMLVSTHVDKRGFIPLSNEQYNRLCDILADERLINTRAETSGSSYNRAWEIATGTAYDTPLSPEASASYLETLRKKAKDSPLRKVEQEKTLWMLAQGNTVLYQGKQWNAEKFSQRADTEIHHFANEMTIRESLLTYSYPLIKKWGEFRDTLEENHVALTPSQIRSLFSVHTNNPDFLLKFLDREKKRQIATEQGIPLVGVPIVTILPHDEVQKGKTFEIKAKVIVSDLKKDRKVKDVKLTWTMPSWAKEQDVKKSIELKNGIVTYKRNIRIPDDVPEDPFEVRVKVEIPESEYPLKPINEGIGSFKFRDEPDVAYFVIKVEGSGFDAARISTKTEKSKECEGSKEWCDKLKKFNNYRGSIRSAPPRPSGASVASGDSYKKKSGSHEEIFELKRGQDLKTELKAHCEWLFSRYLDKLGRHDSDILPEIWDQGPKIEVISDPFFERDSWDSSAAKNRSTWKTGVVKFDSLPEINRQSGCEVSEGGA